jgi:hypothetical protein
MLIKYNMSSCIFDVVLPKKCIFSKKQPFFKKNISKSVVFIVFLMYSSYRSKEKEEKQWKTQKLQKEF